MGACYGFDNDKAASRRCLERPLGEYGPSGARPILGPPACRSRGEDEDE